MTNPRSTQNYKPLVFLSFDEIFYLCSLLDRPPFVGLGVAGYSEEVTLEQRAYGLICAERSLRARGIARFDQTGNIQIQNDILNAVGIAAYAEQTYVLQKITEDSVLDQISSYVLADQAMLLFNPSPMIYGIVILPDREQLIAEMTAYSLPLETTESSHQQHKFLVSKEMLERIQQVSSPMPSNLLVSQLQMEGVPVNSAHAFAETMEKNHTLTSIHVIIPQSQDRTSVQQITVVQSSKIGWLVVESSSNLAGGATVYSVSSLLRDRLAKSFAEWLLPQ
ncbi:MAG: hypothetical protein IPM07_07385 [Anaerolineales bacterium]|nr:hypothetical protein [Anaerolineales bacterium]